ncbi:MAG: hypothetical protein DI536_17230 [Archangium gephyra]|uniref:Uncharacterized protein n=1 Tax=Archangium gephyra TaxID=48 RepID=A0A2W5T971_9BACT|nr:MAG: hypothetical protein DI536_17230 [Archangium gephyra]
MAADDAPKLIKREDDEAKTMSPEAALWGGVDMDRSLEIRKSDVDARMAEAAAAEKADKEEGHEHASDARDDAEKSAKAKGLLKIFSWQKNQSGKPDPKAQLLKNEQTRQQAMKGNAPAFTKQGPSSTATSSARLPMVAARPLTSASASRLNAVGGVQQALMGTPARAERPPDAYALLKDARERGVLFVEDALAEGHSEEQEDPELAEAVEECIRLCFGVRGILRIGPGKNDKNEAIIVVATTNGFSEASLAVVPPKVHRFNTLIAIPFELLPLKRER